MRNDLMSPDEYKRRMSEKDMRTGIHVAVTAKGGRLWYVRDSRNAPETEDMPDLSIVVPPFAMMLELKSQRRKITPGQRDVARLLSQCTHFVGGIVRPDPGPDEFSYDEIVNLLEGI